MNQQPKYNIAETMLMYSENLAKHIKLLEHRIDELEQQNKELQEFKHKQDLDKILGLYVR